MRRSALVLLGLLLALPAMADGDARRGAAFARRNCGPCHAAGPTGASRRPAAPPMRDLHWLFPVDQLAEALAVSILTGHPGMPTLTLTTERIDDLIAYLISLEDR